MRYQRLNTLIPNEGYDVAWTRLDGLKFHGYPHPDSPYAAQDLASQVPGASEEFDWLSRGATIPLSQSVPTTTPLLLADNYRNLLIIQNASTATSPDTAPTLYIGLDGPVSITRIQYAFALAAGIGIVLDTRVLNNSIYAAYGTFSNTNLTTVVAGILTYGRTQNSPPLPAGAVPGAFAGGFNTSVPPGTLIARPAGRFGR